MQPDRQRPLRCSWVLRDVLMLGPAPRSAAHLAQLKQAGITAVLSLCSEAEAPPPPGLEQTFLAARLVLPDHRAPEPMQLAQLEAALARLAQCLSHGPVYVHCVAAMERSPLLCMAWLIRHHRLSRLEALDYLMQVHPGTSPLPEQLALLPFDPHTSLA